MVPARVSCPDDLWTKEYSGYLMASSDQFQPTEFICVDREAEVVPGTAQNQVGAQLYHARVGQCGSESFPCTAYDPQKELACVVCTK